MKKSNEQRKSDRRKKRDEENFWKIMYLTSDDAPTPHVPPVPVSIIKRKLPILPFKRNDEISGIVNWLKYATICFSDRCFNFFHDIYLIVGGIVEDIVASAPVFVARDGDGEGEGGGGGASASIDGGENDVIKYFKNKNNNDKLQIIKALKSKNKDEFDLADKLNIQFLQLIIRLIETDKLKSDNTFYEFIISIPITSTDNNAEEFKKALDAKKIYLGGNVSKTINELLSEYLKKKSSV